MAVWLNQEIHKHWLSIWTAATRRKTKTNKHQKRSRRVQQHGRWKKKVTRTCCFVFQEYSRSRRGGMHSARRQNGNCPLQRTFQAYTHQHTRRRFPLAACTPLCIFSSALFVPLLQQLIFKKGKKKDLAFPPSAPRRQYYSIGKKSCLAVTDKSCCLTDKRTSRRTLCLTWSNEITAAHARRSTKGEKTWR